MTAPTVPVTVRLASFGGPAEAGITVTAKLDQVDYMVDGTFVANDPVTGVTDANGEVVLNLFPNATIQNGGLGTVGSVLRVLATLPSSRKLDVLAAIRNVPCMLTDYIISQEPLGTAASEQAASDAQAARDVAAQWATQLDEPVAGGEFSAKEYAQGDGQEAGGSAKSWASKTDGEVMPGQLSAKQHAINAGADAEATAADREQTGLDRVQTGLDRTATAASAALADTARATAQGAAADTITARDVALAAQRIFATTAAGIAGTVDTNYFFVVSAAADKTLELWKNVAGVATDTGKRFPDLQAVANLIATPVANSQYAHIDGNGNAAMLLENGVHKFASFDAEEILGFKKADFKRRVQRTNLFFSATLVHHIIYGQSLALANGGWLNTLPDVDNGFYDCLRFNANGTTYAGPRAQEGTGTPDQNRSSLVPYLEQPITGSSPTGNGETSLGNALRMVKRLLQTEDGIKYTDFPYLLMGSAPGFSNTSITGLSKGTSPYTTLMLDVTKGLERAQELGYTYAVDVVYWSHGERDIQDGMSRATYLTKLQQLYADLNADIKAVTAQAHDIKMIGYQCTYAAGTQQVALAQLDFAKSNPNYILCTGVYVAEHFDTVNVHLAGTGYPHIGAYYGLAAKRCVIEGGTWPTMYPRRLFRQGTILEAEWPDTGYPLTFSTTYFDQVANQGFTVVGVDGVTDNPITAVSLVGPRRVRINLTNALPGKLRYGFTGGWGGNLHDTCDLDAGLPRDVPLYNPCLTFEEAFA